LDLLNRDPETKVIVLVSKPPAPDVAGNLIEMARATDKPVVVDFIGYATQVRQVDNVYFATTFDETAETALRLARDIPESVTQQDPGAGKFASGQRYLRGLFSGGTLAYEALLILQDYLPAVYSNAPLEKKNLLPDSLVSQEHTLIDLGEDEFTVGRLHPMMDNDLRIRRLEAEAGDPQVAVILLDVVLGYGAHADPAAELAPAIKAARQTAEKAGRFLEVVTVVSGTDEDPQDMDAQIEQLKAAGARVETSNDLAVRYVGRTLRALNPEPIPPVQEITKNVDLDLLRQPLAAINVGVTSFLESLADQGADAIHVDWRPPAGGNQKMMDILARMKSKSQG
jgi:FdrA protein